MVFVLANREAIVQPRDRIGELGLREIESMIGDLRRRCAFQAPPTCSLPLRLSNVALAAEVVSYLPL